MPILEVGDARIGYDLWPGAGDGPALVYCHGLLSSRGGERAASLRAFCAERGWSLLCFDFQGRGESSGSLADLTLTRQIGDLAAALELLPRGAPVVLFGSSYGGLTAAWYAALHPERVGGCVLLAPAFGFVPDLLTRLGADEVQAWRARGERYFEPPVDLTIRYALVEDAAAYPDRVLAASLRVPTLVVHGTADDSVPAERSVALAGTASCVDLYLVRGAGHVLEAVTGEILALVPAFVRRVLG